MAVSERLFADMGLRSGFSGNNRRIEMKYVKKVSAAKVLVSKANVFDDIGNWFHDIGSDDKKN